MSTSPQPRGARGHGWPLHPPGTPWEPPFHRLKEKSRQLLCTSTVTKAIYPHLRLPPLSWGTGQSLFGAQPSQECYCSAPLVCTLGQRAVQMGPWLPSGPQQDRT